MPNTIPICCLSQLYLPNPPENTQNLPLFRPCSKCEACYPCRHETSRCLFGFLLSEISARCHCWGLSTAFAEAQPDAIAEPEALEGENLKLACTAFANGRGLVSVEIFAEKWLKMAGKRLMLRCIRVAGLLTELYSWRILYILVSAYRLRCPKFQKT